MSRFIETVPSLESCWRSVILFGRNVACYKFALAKALLELAGKEETFIALEDLAVPFASHIADALKRNDKQITSSSSKFLDKCREFNQGVISRDELTSLTVSLGFNNVIDAFHVVNDGDIPFRFFEDQRKSANKGIVVTDNLLRLKESLQFNNLPYEVEARWRLVETAWALGVNRKVLTIGYDEETQELITPHLQRPVVTSCRDALNGYQKGKCFYCFTDISVETDSDRLADVDHFFPHALKYMVPSNDANLDGVWNLVLACKECNRGSGGKFAKVPTIRLLERLKKRNDFLISSHHPLRETLIGQTGVTANLRLDFLQSMDSMAISHLIHRWEPSFEHEAFF